MLASPFKETELHCVANKIAFGAVLLQRQEDGKFHPTSFYSKTTSVQEKNYHNFELETLATIYAMIQYRINLKSIAFKIVTDCEAFTHTLDRKPENREIDNGSRAI